SVRMQAFITLAAIGPEAKPAAAAINKGLEDAEGSVRYAAAFAAGRLAEDADKTTTGKLEALAAQDKDEFLKTVATWALAKIHRGDEKRLTAAVELLAKGLVAKEPRQRSASLMGLVELKPEPAILVPAVLAVLEDADPEDAPNVFAALADFGPLPPELLLGVSSPKLRLQALYMLAQQKAAPLLLVPALLAAIDATEKDEAERAELLLALANYGEDAKSAVEPMRKILMNEEAGVVVRRRAAYVLGRIGAEAWAAQTDLEKLLKSDEMGLRVAAAWALVRVAPKSKESLTLATPILIEGLNDERAVVKVELANALGSIGPAAAEAVPALRKLATDADPELSKAATEALEKIQP
ncbi:MAG TPA: HEAT repeat domain-containing protein, partial [Pirellulales bacterium]